MVPSFPRRHSSRWRSNGILSTSASSPTMMVTSIFYATTPPRKSAGILRRRVTPARPALISELALVSSFSACTTVKLATGSPFPTYPNTLRKLRPRVIGSLRCCESIGFWSRKMEASGWCLLPTSVRAMPNPPLKRTPRRRRSAGIRCLLILFLSAATSAQPFDPSNFGSWNDFRNAPPQRALVKSIEGMKWWDACVAYGREFRSNKNQVRETALLRYLESEELLGPEDRGHIGDRTVAIGMTQCGVFAAIGTPTGGTHQTTTAYSETTQLVYENPRRYIYTERGKSHRLQVVRAIQR